MDNTFEEIIIKWFAVIIILITISMLLFVLEVIFQSNKYPITHEITYKFVSNVCPVSKTCEVEVK